MESYNNRNLVSKKYEIIKKLGSGSFGEVYLTKILSSGALVASKIEERENKKKTSKILDEYKIYKKLELKGLKKGIPKIYSIYETPKFNVLVMELLGENLETIFNSFHKKFKLGTILKIGCDMINIIEKVHNCGIIHRDIKTNNFMFGVGDKKYDLFILDFGLSKKFFKNNKHIEYKTNKSLVGTARYTSINIHLGIEPSRRDDLESICYMLLFFLKGELPWQGLKKQKNTDHLELIGEVKLSTSTKSLCKDTPKCFNNIIDYIRKLSFDERPNYTMIREQLIECANLYKEKLEYEF